MANACEVCGKKTTFGIKYARRGAPKKRGGSGAKISGKTNRTFRPNIQRIRCETKGGGVKRMKVCTECIKAGKIRKYNRAPYRPEPAEA